MAARKKTPRRKATNPSPSANNVRLLDQDQTRIAGRAGLAILNHEAGVIPNGVRNQVSLLESVLTGLSTGEFSVVVNQAKRPADPATSPEEPKKDESA